MCEMIAAGYRITMDTDIENAFVVHCDGGKQMRFVNRKGVYVLEQHGVNTEPLIEVDRGWKFSEVSFLINKSIAHISVHIEISYCHRKNKIRNEITRKHAELANLPA